MVVTIEKLRYVLSIKVHGTTNLRIVDLSVLPLHVAAHPQCMEPNRDFSAVRSSLCFLQPLSMRWQSKVSVFSAPVFVTTHELNAASDPAADIIQGKFSA